MVRQFLVFFSLILFATLCWASGEVVYFKNGKALRIQTKTVSDGWLNVTLPGGASMSFPEKVVDRVVKEDGVTAQPVSISTVSSGSKAKGKPKAGGSRGSRSGNQTNAQGGTNATKAKGKAPSGGRPQPGMTAPKTSAKATSGPGGRRTGPKIKKKPLLKPGK